MGLAGAPVRDDVTDSVFSDSFPRNGLLLEKETALGCRLYLPEPSLDPKLCTRAAAPSWGT